jgi:apolipoprotein N-acyltransferase
VPLRLLVSAVGGLLLAAAFEPIGFAVLLPVGVAVAVLSVRGLPAARAWAPGLVLGGAFSFTLMIWMRAVGTDAWLALSALEAAFFAPLGVVLARLQRLRWWPVWTALAWVLVEGVRSSWPMSGMPWGRLAFATADTVWQPALPWLGASGVSVLVALCGTTLAWLVVGGVRRPRAALAAAGGLAVVTLAPAVVGFDVTEDGTATVAVVQGDVPGTGTDLVDVHRAVTANHVHATEELADQVAAGERPRPDFVLWPENSTAVDPFLDADVAAGVEAASESIGVPILVGAMVDGTDPQTVLNQGIVVRPGVGGGDRYTKRHPVPFGEYIPWRDTIFSSNFGKLDMVPRDMASGTGLEPLRIGGVRVADAICFDIAYDDGVLGQVANGGEMLAVQTSNALFIRTHQIDQQFEITRLRAVETGRWVTVASPNGISGVVAPDGAVVGQAEPRTTTVLVEEVGLSTELTPAVRMGLWPGRVIGVVALLAIAATLVPYRRRHGAEGLERPRRQPVEQGAST